MTFLLRHRRTMLALSFSIFALLLCSLLLPLWIFELIASQLPLLYLIGLLMLLIYGVLSLRSRSSFFEHFILMWLIIIAATIPLTSLSGSFTFRASKITDHRSITYSTYNKLFTNRDLESASTIFRQNMPDLISFQEIRPAELDYYISELGLGYSSITNNDASAEDTEIALLSRFPITSSDTLQLSQENEALRSIVTIPDLGDIAVYSVHVFPPFSSHLHRASYDAIKELRQLIDTDPLPVLMAGDFNTTLHSPKLRPLSSSPSGGKALSIPSPQSDLSCTWFGYNLCMRIDHIFFSDPFSAADYHIAQPTGSDHRIIIATLTY